MKITYLHPFGVNITDFDVNNEQHLAQIPSLLFANGFILLPAGSAAKGAPDVHDPHTMVRLGEQLGTPELSHSIKENIKENLPVHLLETNGPHSCRPDSFLFHSDTSWRSDPNLASVLCCKKPSAKGGATTFIDAKAFVNRLSPASLQLLSTHTFNHSLHRGYKIVGDDAAVDDKPDVVTAHPGIVRHPRTGVPFVYVTDNYCSGIAGMPELESAPLMQDLFDDMYIDWERHAYVHHWTVNDTVIWDNLGTQHKAANDYTDLRVMYRVVCRDPTSALTKYEMPLGVE